MPIAHSEQHGPARAPPPGLNAEGAARDRWVAGEVEDGGEASNDFVAQMWSLYREQPPAVTTCR